MSGQGLISIRIPLSLLDVFRTAALSSKYTLHGAARTLISGARGLTSVQLTALQEPPRALQSPRVSLYVGAQCLSILTERARTSQLSASSIFRRLAYGLFVNRSIRFVQNTANKEWLLVSVQNSSEIGFFDRTGEKRDAAS
jgi:hypothetical protein